MSKNYYSITELISTAIAYGLTKIAYPQARLMRRPLYIRGRRGLVGCKELTTGHGCRFDLIGNKKTLFIGENCELGDYVHIVAHQEVNIGKNVLIASKVFISDTNHGEYKGECQSSPVEKPNHRKLITSQVKIGDNVWIGENVVILQGSEIGEGCVIGANSVISGKFDSFTMIAGAPGRIIKTWCKKEKKWKPFRDRRDYI